MTVILHITWLMVLQTSEHGVSNTSFGMEEVTLSTLFNERLLKIKAYKMLQGTSSMLKERQPDDVLNNVT